MRPGWAPAFVPVGPYRPPVARLPGRQREKPTPTTARLRRVLFERFSLSAFSILYFAGDCSVAPVSPPQYALGWRCKSKAQLMRIRNLDYFECGRLWLG